MATTDRPESTDDLTSPNGLPCIVVGGTSAGANAKTSSSDDTKQDYEADFGPVQATPAPFRDSPTTRWRLGGRIHKAVSRANTAPAIRSDVGEEEMRNRSQQRQLAAPNLPPSPRRPTGHSGEAGHQLEIPPSKSQDAPTEHGEVRIVPEAVPAIENGMEYGRPDKGSVASELAERGVKRVSSTPQSGTPEKKRRTTDHAANPASQSAHSFNDRLTPAEDETSASADRNNPQSSIGTPKTRARVNGSATSPFPEHRGACNVQEEEIMYAQNRSQKALIKQREKLIEQLEDENSSLKTKLAQAEEKLAFFLSPRSKRQRK